MTLRVLAAGCLLLSISQAGLAASSVGANIALTSDYLFRGLSQTWGGPALQGGLDWNGGRWHVGTWASNVSGNSFPGGGVEVDMFADAAFWQRGDWSARAGLYAYLYPGANLDRARPALPGRTLDTLEANVSLQWKRWTLKYSRSLGDYFGADVEQGYAHDTRGTEYLQLDGDVPLSPRWNLHLHAGHTHYSAALAAALPDGTVDPDYSDFSLTAGYALTARWSLGATLGHSTNETVYGHVASLRDPSSQRDLGGTRAIVSLSTTF